VPKRVFISYRREDTAPAAGRVYDRLCRLISKSNVFFDVSTISGGEIYDRKIMSEIERSEAVLVFIGKSWLMSNGRMRLQEPDDYVRAEVRAALGRPILVLPVLVDGVQMPLPDQLPDDIRALSTRNALSLRHESFDDDTENIVAAVLGVAEGARPWDDRGRVAVKVGYAALACSLPQPRCWSRRLCISGWRAGRCRRRSARRRRRSCCSPLRSSAWASGLAARRTGASSGTREQRRGRRAPATTMVMLLWAAWEWDEAVAVRHSHLR